MKIVILDGHTVVQKDLSWDELREFGDLTCYERTPADKVISRIGSADIVITSKCIIDKNVLDSCPSIKYIGVIATGYNNIDVASASKKGITVTNIPAYSTDSVAQFAFSLLLEAANRVGVHSQSVGNGDWSKSKDFSYVLTPQMELAGKTIGVIGYGNIGKRVASLAVAFGLNVLVYSSYMNGTDSTDDITFVDLDELLSESDIISLHCALNENNRGLINRGTISKMKDNVIIINTSRGPLINEDDLAEALQNGKISVAALDVLSEEPPAQNNPLIGLSNCIITPHIAWITKEARQRLITTAVDNVRFFLERKTENEVH